MDENFIEIMDVGNPDLSAFLFCAEAIVKENKDQRKQVTRLYIENGIVYSTNGKSARKAILGNDYQNGFYRVLRKDKDDVILYFDGNEDAPDFAEMVNTDGIPALGKVTIEDDFFPAHAIVTHLTDVVFRAEILKKAVGTYDIFKKEKMIVLDDGANAIAIAPIQTQTSIPGV